MPSRDQASGMNFLQGSDTGELPPLEGDELCEEGAKNDRSMASQHFEVEAWMPIGTQLHGCIAKTTLTSNTKGRFSGLYNTSNPSYRIQRSIASNIFTSSVKTPHSSL